MMLLRGAQGSTRAVDQRARSGLWDVRSMEGLAPRLAFDICLGEALLLKRLIVIAMTNTKAASSHRKAACSGSTTATGQGARSANPSVPQVTGVNMTVASADTADASKTRRAIKPCGASLRQKRNRSAKPQIGYVKRARTRTDIARGAKLNMQRQVFVATTSRLSPEHGRDKWPNARMEYGF